MSKKIINLYQKYKEEYETTGNNFEKYYYYARKLRKSTINLEKKSINNFLNEQPINKVKETDNITLLIKSINNDKIVNTNLINKNVNIMYNYDKDKINKYIVYLDDTIILYKIKYYKDWFIDWNIRLLNKINKKKEINVFNITNSKKKIYIFHKDFYNSFLKQEKLEYYFHDEELGYEINNKKKDSDIGIILVHQQINNIFTTYLINMLENIKDKKITIYIYYGSKSPFGYIDFKYTDIVFINENNIYDIIKRDNNKFVYFLYLPLSHIKNNEKIKKLLYDNLIKKYIMVAGTLSHHFHYLSYPINGVVIKGWNPILDNYKNISIHKIYLTNSSLFNLIKFKRKNKYKLKNTFITISRFDISKNILFLIKSFALFLKENKNFKLYIVGEGIIKYEFQTFINENNLSNNIILLDWFNNKESLYEFVSNNIDYNISTSLTEGISNVILENMIIGVPTIASNIYGSREIIEHNHNGLLFNFKNYEKLILKKDYVKEILKSMDSNITELLKIFNYVKNNQELYNKLSRNCINYMDKEHLKFKSIDYDKIFK